MVVFLLYCIRQISMEFTYINMFNRIAPSLLDNKPDILFPPAMIQSQYICSRAQGTQIKINMVGLSTCLMNFFDKAACGCIPDTKNHWTFFIEFDGNIKRSIGRIGMEYKFFYKFLIPKPSALFLSCVFNNGNFFIAGNDFNKGINNPTINVKFKNFKFYWLFY